MAATEKEHLTIVIHDTETTGVDEEDRILQSAHAVFDLDPDSGDMKVRGFTDEIIKPPVECKPDAAAVHGIWKTDYAEAPSWEESESKKELENLVKQGAVYVAHNAFFDLNMLSKEGLTWDMDKVVDTLTVARHMFKNDENVKKSSLQWLRYHFDFDSQKEFRDFVASFGIERLQAHTALSDIVVLAFLMKKFIKMTGNFYSVMSLSATPYIEEKIFFGNVFEKGVVSIEEAAGSVYVQYNKQKRGIDYLKWAIENMDFGIREKMALANGVMKAVKNGSLKPTDKSLVKMLYVAHAFLPEHWDITEKIFDRQSEDLRRRIQQKAIENAKDGAEKMYINFLIRNASR